MLRMCIYEYYERIVVFLTSSQTSKVMFLFLGGIIKYKISRKSIENVQVAEHD